MKSAVDNVKSLSSELNLELNKQRQGKITQEVSEIISAFKVLQKTR
jgi:F0F1-type ATP synthase gamma subunit